MRRKSFILLYVGMTTVSLLVTVAVSAFAKSGSLQREFFLQFLPNILFCLLFGMFDLYVISSNLKRKRFKNNAVRIATDLLVTTLVAVLLPSCVNYWFLEPPSVEMAVRNSLLIIPWNWLVVLQLEIFYYNLKQKELQREKSLYQFEALKNQINPHFLFNCLNVLASLAYQDAEKANRFAKKLSFVYRYLLTTQELMEVPLQDELDFVKSYTYLEQIRFGESLHINLTYDEQALRKSIVPASIQMLVENALKHNINTRESPLMIDIRISEENVTVTNNLQLRSSVSKNHTGLDNLEKQYRIHGKHIEVMKSDFMFTVVLPLL